MNLKKRLTAALLSAALALSLVACGSPATQESPSTAPSPSAEPASAGHTADDMIVLAGALLWPMVWRMSISPTSSWVHGNR